MLCVLFSVTQVHLYVVKNNLTDTEAFIDVVDKEFLTSNDAFAVVSADDAGSPSNNIKGLNISVLITQSGNGDSGCC